ncbi:MAG: thioredoxin [Clostridiales bacterium]|jgi:thioredoxin 1|nr:thioredoxin [Clostridiales bacterium]
MEYTENLLKFTDANFEDLIKSEMPVLVDFYADWCGPCKMLAPHISKLADEFKDRAAVGKLNVDDNPETAEKYGVMSIPTLIIFKDGVLAEKKVGFVRYDELKVILEKRL